MIKTNFIILSFTSAFLFANSLHAMEEKMGEEPQGSKSSSVKSSEFFSPEIKAQDEKVQRLVKEFQVQKLEFGQLALQNFKALAQRDIPETIGKKAQALQAKEEEVKSEIKKLFDNQYKEAIDILLGNDEEKANEYLKYVHRFHGV